MESSSPGLRRVSVIQRNMWEIVSLLPLLVCLDSCGAGAAISHLSEREYTQLPPLFHLDPYKECIQEGGEYCSLRLQLVSDQRNKSNLLKTIEQYSAYKTHYNHSVLNHGICITTTCKHILQSNTTRDPRQTLEGCLNRTLWKDYRLRAKVTEEPSCHKANENSDSIGVLDVIVAVLLGTVLVLNVVGTVWELITGEKDNSILSRFSLKRNWQALTAPSRVPDSRMEGMKAFTGIRSILSILVICIHSLMPFIISSANPREWEESYTYMKYIDAGSLIMQMFLAMSGFLMAYNMVMNEGERRESCLNVAIKILLRWLRLAPSYMVVLALTVTWLRFAGSGPLWQTAVRDHIESCRLNWWRVPLNIINYVDHTQCFAEYWYISVDMQLSMLGLLVFGLMRGRVRWWTLGFLLVGGLVAPAMHTWMKDLDGWIIPTPEVLRYFFVQDPTFNHVFKRGHTNVAAYVIGAAVGMLVCRWQGNHGEKINNEKLQKYRFIYWSTVPVIFATVFSGSVFVEAPTPLVLRVGYSVLGRMVFGACAAILLAGLTLKIEDLYRGILGWSGWTPLSRLSYCAYVVHVALIRLYTGSRTTLSHVSVANILYVMLGTVLATFLVAIPLWLFVEAPVIGVIKHLARKSTSEGPVVKSGEEKYTVNTSDTTEHVVEIIKENLEK